MGVGGRQEERGCFYWGGPVPTPRHTNWIPDSTQPARGWVWNGGSTHWHGMPVSPSIATRFGTDH